MWQCGAYFLLGATVPLVGKFAKPMARKALKTGIVASRAAQRVVARVREDLQDIVAEAAAEADSKA